MTTIKLLKDHQHLSNRWKKGDEPTVGNDLAKELVKQRIAKVLKANHSPEKPQEPEEETDETMADAIAEKVVQRLLPNEPDPQTTEV